MAGPPPRGSTSSRDRPVRARASRIVLATLGASVVVALLVIFGGLHAAVTVRAPVGSVSSDSVPAGSSLAGAASAAPTIVSFVSNLSITDVGMPVNFTVNATGGSGMYSYIWSAPAVCVASNQTDICTPTSTTPLAVSVTVKDNVTTLSTTSKTLTVNVNPAPTISSFSASSARITLGQTVWFNTSAKDGTPPYTYNYLGLPIGCHAVATSNSIPCKPNATGAYKVVVSVMDSVNSTTASQNVTLNVTAAPVSHPSGPGSTGWAVIGAIVVIGAIIVAALLIRARREERVTFMATPPGSPPQGGTSPPGAGGSSPPEAPPPGNPPG
jgi:hypothetical protein